MTKFVTWTEDSAEIAEEAARKSGREPYSKEQRADFKELASSLRAAFSWGDTDDGYSYWSAIFQKLTGMSEEVPPVEKITYLRLFDAASGAVTMRVVDVNGEQCMRSNLVSITESGALRRYAGVGGNYGFTLDEIERVTLSGE